MLYSQPWTSCAYGPSHRELFPDNCLRFPTFTASTSIEPCPSKHFSMSRELTDLPLVTHSFGAHFNAMENNWSANHLVYSGCAEHKAIRDYNNSTRLHNTASLLPSPTLSSGIFDSPLLAISVNIGFWASTTRKQVTCVPRCVSPIGTQTWGLGNVVE